MKDLPAVVAAGAANAAIADVNAPQLATLQPAQLQVTDLNTLDGQAVDRLDLSTVVEQKFGQLGSDDIGSISDGAIS